MLSRKIFKKLKEQANDTKISLLLGARQVGKTTLLKQAPSNQIPSSKSQTRLEFGTL